MSVPVIHAFFEDLIKRGGSDLHFAVNQPPLGRVRGEIVPLRETPVGAKELEEMLLEVVTPAQRSHLAAELDLDLAVAYDEVARFRGSYFVRHSGIAATFRLVPVRAPSLAELASPEILWRLADRRSGLVLVAGPAANGKTTTIGAMVDHVNKTRACQIVTIENPLEYVHEPLRAQVTHREVGAHTPNIAAGLRSAAREGADVVYASELATARDISVALELASDGVLVFAALNASSAASAVMRMVAGFDMDEQPGIQALLADGLAAVVVQHLVRAADSKSRISVHEILLGTPEVAQLVRDGKMGDLDGVLSSADKASAQSHGMQSLDVGLARLVEAGKISSEAAFERAVDKSAFAAARTIEN